MAADPKYHELLDYMWDLHVAKAAGYSGTDNPDTWANFREAAAWGTSALRGCLVRLGDKYRRAQNLTRSEDADMVGEPLPKTLIDLAAYSLIGIRLWEEEHPGIEWREPVGQQRDQRPT